MLDPRMFFCKGFQNNFFLPSPSAEEFLLPLLFGGSNLRIFFSANGPNPILPFPHQSLLQVRLPCISCVCMRVRVYVHVCACVCGVCMFVGQRERERAHARARASERARESERERASERGDARVCVCVACAHKPDVCACCTEESSACRDLYSSVLWWCVCVCGWGGL